MKLFFTLFALLFISFSGFGQTVKIDSLKSIYRIEQSKVKRIVIMNDLCNELLEQSSFEKSKSYYFEFLKLAKQNKTPIYLSKAHQILSRAYEIDRNFEEAKKHIELSIKINSKSRNNELLAEDYNRCGSIYNRFEKYDSAIIFFEKSIQLYKKTGKENSSAYMNLSATLNNLERTSEAIEYTIKAIEIAEQNNDIELQVRGMLSLGHHSIKNVDYKTAEKYLLKANKLAETQNIDPSFLCESYRFLGLNYSRASEFEKALSYNEKAIDCYKNIGDKLFVLDVLINTSAIYGRMEQYENQLSVSKMALDAAIEAKSQLGINAVKLNMTGAEINLGYYDAAEKKLFDVLKDTLNSEYLTKDLEKICYQNIAYLFMKKQDYKSSINWFIKYKDLEDSLQLSMIQNSTKEIETRYQTEKKEKQIAEQQLRLTKENRNKWLLSGGLIGSLAILGVVGFSYQRNRKQKEQIENLQKELHHRVKNNLSIIDTFIEVVKKELPDAKAQGKLNELQNRIISINEVHRQLYNSKNITSLYLKKYIDTLAENVSHSFDKPEIELKTEIPETAVLSAERSFPVGLIVNEFLTNSYKYAFENNGAGKIWVSLKEKGNSFLLSLSDNGKGLPAGFDVKETNSFGLRIIKLLTEQLNGNFSMKGDDGVSLEIEFPKT
ncbi:MAG: tetratricopeptide repeat protein [Flavobacteriia bacterium]|nr:tetratricopeptide repeat protein [Flavobacteriia bacterium]